MNKIITKRKKTKYKTLKFFNVFNNEDGYGKLNAKFSSERAAIENLKKSEVMMSTIIWRHQDTKIEGYNFTNLKHNDKTVFKNLTFRVNGEKLIYECELEFTVWNVTYHPEIKEEGKPYKAASEEKTDITNVLVPVQGSINCNWVSIKLDGIPDYRGDTIFLEDSSLE